MQSSKATDQISVFYKNERARDGDPKFTLLNEKKTLFGNFITR